MAHGDKLHTEPLALHWNGRNWIQTRLPGPAHAILSAVAIISATNVWAVGTYGRTELFLRSLIEHWNGRTWKIIPSHDPGSPKGDHELSFMAGTTPADMWAVGQYGFKAAHSLVVHCCRWRVLPPKL